MCCPAVSVRGPLLKTRDLIFFSFQNLNLLYSVSAFSRQLNAAKTLICVTANSDLP